MIAAGGGNGVAGPVPPRRPRAAAGRDRVRPPA
jgi:hypothetical protein